MKLIPRTKRKIKESERKVPNVILGSPSNKKSHSKAIRKSTKLPSTKNAVSRSEKDIVKPRTVTEKQTSPLLSLAQGEPLKTNTTSSVNRALWGDMCDVTEVDEEFLEYSASAEIPFAVGLLPLRAALERMQATLDHQPRKTRSSVTKLESSSLKRKHSPEAATKKQNCGEDIVEQNPSAVCHIQIRTSPTCSRPRKDSLSEGTTSLEQTSVTESP
ncbi:hypothetical protein QAD02_017731 [Eretmocerus hayati]|uniref:Uncharacterized protein n=1 Tax=Eretmocerus hayati TaxID=131215 RepID=A0ACC2PEE9_9HYME|nr:hypothetical protein QAD02_017731 [Eretmocerus hayati]